MIKMTKAFQNMETLCSSKNFVRRGTAFFRVHGDGVLQILKVEKIPHWDAYEIFLDLYSMYDELDSNSFSSRWCDVRYALVIFCGKRSAQYIEDVGGHYEGRIISMDTQVALLETTVMPFLDEVKTQAQLANAMCKLDELTYSHTIIWNDGYKYVPFLHSGDYLSAQRVIQAILDQHQFAAERRRLTMLPHEYEVFCADLYERDKVLIQKKQIAAAQDKGIIEAYFQENFDRNCKLSKFVKKRGK